jgi:hypothetical protein
MGCTEVSDFAAGRRCSRTRARSSAGKAKRRYCSCSMADRIVIISRAAGTLTFAASFVLHERG